MYKMCNFWMYSVNLGVLIHKGDDDAVEVFEDNGMDDCSLETIFETGTEDQSASVMD